MFIQACGRVGLGIGVGVRWQVEDTAERAAFRAGFRQWVARVLPQGWVEAVEFGDEKALEAARAGFDGIGWTALIGASGYAAPHWPAEHGGMSAEAWATQVVREELRRYRLPPFGLNILGIGMAGPTLIAHGSDEQKTRHLPRILSGEETWCQLFSEPGAGSDLASLTTRAEHDGETWVVNGQKVWTTIAQFANFGMLLARSDPHVPKHDGLTWFCLDMSAPGVTVRPLRQMTGAAEFNEVFLDDVRIPDTDRVGAPGEGWRVARTTLMNERTTLAGLSLEPASVSGGRSDPFQRLAAGLAGPAGPLARQGLARMYTENEIKEITAFRGASARRAGQPPGPEGAVGKVFNAEHNQRRTTMAVDTAGPGGVAWEAGDRAAEWKALGFLRARAATIEGGTSEILRNQIAERVLGLPREPDADRDTPWRNLKRG